MAEYHVGCGAFAIYAGTLNKNKTMWNNKTECTDEAINAVRDYMAEQLLGGFDCEKTDKSGYEWKLKDGRTVKLMIEIDGESELKKGHWEDFDCCNSYRCTSCGEIWTLNDGTPEENNMNYCPKCGADMRGEQE